MRYIVNYTTVGVRKDAIPVHVQLEME